MPTLMGFYQYFMKLALSVILYSGGKVEVRPFILIQIGMNQGLKQYKLIPVSGGYFSGIALLTKSALKRVLMSGEISSMVDI